MKTWQGVDSKSKIKYETKEELRWERNGTTAGRPKSSVVSV